MYSADDINMRLVGCYFLDRGGRVVNVRSHSEASDKAFPDLIVQNSDGRMEEVPQDSLNMSFFPLGYIQSGRGAIYLHRRPVRKWKRGICLGVNLYGRWANKPVRVEPYVDVDSLQNLVDGRYPSLGSAIKDSEIMGEAVAVARRWAVRGTTVFYKGKNAVGGISETGIKLKPKYSYLKEVWEEDVCVKV